MALTISHSRPTLDASDIKAVTKVLQSSLIAQGQTVETFEANFSKYLGCQNSAATNCGTSALHLALLSLGIKKGDEVILPSYVCSALLHAVLYTNATPRLVDVNADDFNISLEETKKKINKKTKAIIVVHSFGCPIDLKGFLKLGVPIIEDCAQSIGATYRGQKIGTFGNIGITSFYATKMLTTGEGGMVFSNNRKLISAVKDLRDYDQKPQHKLRFNYKMTDFQAALGISQLKKLPTFIQKRKQIASLYAKALGVTTNRDHIYFRYILQAQNATLAIKHLKKVGIVASKPIYKALHEYNHQKGFAVSNRLMQTNVSIPIYPSLKPQEIDYIISKMKHL
jgi:perosamine synthetase